MPESATFTIEPLAKQHDRTSFACGEAELDRYLKEIATQDIKRNIAKVFVAAGGNRVIGFYSLSATSIACNSLPDAVSRKLPKYPVPAALLGRLARDVSQRGRGLGEALMVDAMKRVLLAGREVAMYALVVDAKHAQAAVFYRRYGFMALEQNAMRLFLPLDTIAQCIK